MPPTEPTHNRRAPLLWFLLPFVAGLAGGLVAAPLPTAAMGLALVVTTLGVVLASSEPPTPLQLVWYPLFAAAAGLAGALYGDLRTDRLPTDYQWLPAREATVTLTIDRIFAPPQDYSGARGLAVITSAPPHLNDLIDLPVYFSTALPGELTILRRSAWRIRGVLEAIPRENPDEFQQYLQRAGILFMFRRGQVIERVREAPANILIADRVSAFLDRTWHRGAGPDAMEPDLVAAAMLGRREVIPQDLRETFETVGAMHLFAVSGLHIGIVAGVLYLVGGVLRLKDRPRVLATLVLLYGYVELAGASPSAVRAYTMVFCFLGARLIRRKPVPLSALAASALLVLLWDPHQLFNPGFQLSYAVVAAILLYAVPLFEECEQFLERRRSPVAPAPGKMGISVVASRALIRYSAGAITVSFAAFIASVPITASFFGVISPGGVILNALLVQLALPLIVAAILSALFAAIGISSLCLFFNHAAWLVVHVMAALTESALHWRGLFRETDGFPGYAAAAVIGAQLAIWLFVPRFHPRGHHLFLWGPVAVTIPVLLFA